MKKGPAGWILVPRKVRRDKGSSTVHPFSIRKSEVSCGFSDRLGMQGIGTHKKSSLAAEWLEMLVFVYYFE